tara:strand:+ start:2303 stop:2569 length:267 start_codon:yes stop_codon:yes gene_type:complete
MTKIDLESRIGECQNLRLLIIDFIDTASDDEDERAWQRHLETYEALLKEVKELRKWIAQAVDVWKNCNHNDTQDWFNDFCEVHQQKEE